MEGSVREGEGMLPPLNPMAGQEEEEEKYGFDSNRKTKEEIVIEEQEEGKGGGGLIRNLMSTMATPLGTRTGEAETEDDARNEIPKKEGEEDGDVGVEEGGILNNIISNLFHQNGDQQGKKMEDDDEEKNKQVKTEEDTNGGVIENIVSHLPPSIPDDAVPTADEAAILINSLVRD